jgi:hypothetical protein
MSVVGLKLFLRYQSPHASSAVLTTSNDRCKVHSNTSPSRERGRHLLGCKSRLLHQVHVLLYILFANLFPMFINCRAGNLPSDIYWRGGSRPAPLKLGVRASSPRLFSGMAKACRHMNGTGVAGQGFCCPYHWRARTNRVNQCRQHSTQTGCHCSMFPTFRQIHVYIQVVQQGPAHHRAAHLCLLPSLPSLLSCITQSLLASLLPVTCVEYTGYHA